MKLPLKQQTMNENQFRDWNYMFQNTDIKQIETCKKGDIIQLFGRNYTVQLDCRHREKLLRIDVFYIKNGIKKHIQHPIKRIVQMYYEQTTDIDTHVSMIFHKDDNSFNNKYNNLLITKTHLIPIELKYDWNFKYQNTDINSLINAKEGDKIYLYDRIVELHYGSNIVDLYARPTFDNNTSSQFKVYRLIYELYNKEILSDEYHIHHIDGNHFNNKPENLQKLTISEHSRLHFEKNDKQIYQLSVPIYNLKTGEIYNSVGETVRKNPNIYLNDINHVLSNNNRGIEEYKGFTTLNILFKILDRDTYKFGIEDLYDRNENILYLPEDIYKNNKWIDEYIWN